MKRPGLEKGLRILGKIKNPVVVDVGAYVGKIVRLCKEANKDVFSYALEPDPVNFLILKSTYDHDKNVDCCDCAIGKTEDTILYVVNREGLLGTSESNTLFKKVLKDKKKRGKNIGKISEVFIHSYTMDDFIEAKKIKKIDLLKLNCEGGEYDVFSGNPDFFKITRMIYVSFHAQNKPFNKPEYEEKRQYAYSLLEKNGFKFSGGIPKEVRKKHMWQLWRKT